MNIYISCGLTRVNRGHFAHYVSLIHALADRLREQGATKVSYALMDSDPYLAKVAPSERALRCYEWDRALVEEATIVIAETTYPSIGVGIELQIATASGIPIILCHNDSPEYRSKPIDYDNPDNSHHQLQIGEGFVSLMALGLPTLAGVVTYRSKTELLSRICETLATLKIEH